MDERAHVVTEIVTDALGERPTSVEHVPTLEDSTVYRVEVPSGWVFFKNEHEGHPIDTTAWAYEKAKSIGIPVPDVLYLDMSKERWPDAFVIITSLAGTDLQTEPLEVTALEETLGRIGELLNHLHEVHLEGYGDLILRQDGEPTGEHPDHVSYVRARPSWGLPYAVDHGLIDANTHAAIEQIVAHHDELATYTDPGSLIHGDLGLDHVFVDRTTMEITGLIDFEAECTDPVVDLAKIHYHYPDLFPHLLRGYGPTPADLDVRLELYGLLQAIGSLRWEHERSFESYLLHAQLEVARRTKKLGALL